MDLTKMKVNRWTKGGNNLYFLTKGNYLLILYATYKLSGIYIKIKHLQYWQFYLSYYNICKWILVTINRDGIAKVFIASMVVMTR